MHVLSWSGKLLSVLNVNTGLQFLKMSHGEDMGCWDAGLEIMAGVINSFMMNRNTNTSVGKICGH